MKKNSREEFRLCPIGAVPYLSTYHMHAAAIGRHYEPSKNPPRGERCPKKTDPLAEPYLSR